MSTSTIMSGSNTEQASQASEPEKQGKAGLIDEAAGSQHHEAGPIESCCRANRMKKPRARLGTTRPAAVP